MDQSPRPPSLAPELKRPAARKGARGEHFIWLAGAALGVCLLMIIGLLGIVIGNGAGYFWPHQLVAVDAEDGAKVLGALVRTEEFRKFSPDSGNAVRLLTRSQFKIGNRDIYGVDFKWVQHPQIVNWQLPEQAVALERTEYGDFYGFLEAVKEDGKTVAQGAAAWALFENRRPEARALARQWMHIQKVEIGEINRQLQAAALRAKRALRKLGGTPELPGTLALFAAETNQLNAAFETLKTRVGALQKQATRFTAVMRTIDGKEKEIPLAEIVRATKPNLLGFGDRWRYYLAKTWEFISADPRESNTEGGIFPAIFGTVMMTLLMSVAVVPLGVLAALYLREYARQGFWVRLVRIAVNNLAGVPSIVFGVFGLGFFVYFVGGTIDQLFYADSLPAPTFGTGGILWASLTLALLTVPVVIVATEEAIAAVPRGAREGSLALGASKFQTVWRIVLPASMPGILTGLILAMARGAGEVAPLMITGVVKLAPNLPLDGQFPLLHLDRKFMHLGFHIYDVGFQSPNVEAAKPMVFATTLLLILVVVALNLSAMILRDKIRKKYRSGAF